MMQWWNDKTIKAFRERAQCIVDQYSRYKLREVDQYIDGRMTQGENIADNGGLKQSFRVSLYIHSMFYLFISIFKINLLNYFRHIKNGLQYTVKSHFYQE